MPTTVGLHVEHADGAGNSVVTIFLDDLDAHVAAIAARGLQPDERLTYSNGVRKALYRDVDGNELGFGGAPLATASYRPGLPSIAFARRRSLTKRNGWWGSLRLTRGSPTPRRSRSRLTVASTLEAALRIGPGETLPRDEEEASAARRPLSLRC